MYCKNCGAEYPSPDSVTCVKCGAPKGEGNRFCYNCGHPVDPNAAVCTNCGCTFEVALDDSEEGEEPEDEEEQPEDASYEVTCPLCGTVTVLDEDTLLSGNAHCSGCGKPLEIDLPEED